MRHFKHKWIRMVPIYSCFTELAYRPNEALLLQEGGLQCHLPVSLMSANTSDEVIEKRTERCEMSVDRRNHGALSLGASAAFLAFVLVVGASSAAFSAGSVVKEPQYGFSFALPAGWQEVPLDGSDVTALLNIATHNDPSLTKALGNEVSSAPSKGMKVFAIGPASDSSAPNVNVIVVLLRELQPGGIFAPAAIAEAKIEFAQLGASHIKSSIVNNRLGRSAQVTYELNLNGIHEFGDQFYALHTSHVDIVTLTTGSFTNSEVDARIVVNSWRW